MRVAVCLVCKREGVEFTGNKWVVVNHITGKHKGVAGKFLTQPMRGKHWNWKDLEDEP